jgi:hypothetical protein
MIATTRIPTHRNDGSRITKRELQAILTRVRKELGASSLEGPFPGAWTASDGEVYEENSYKLEVVITRRRINDARKLFVGIGKQLGQRAVYYRS